VAVTQDSVTMVTEAVASGRPVVVVRPADVRFPAGSFMSGYLSNLQSAGRIVCARIGDLGTTMFQPARFCARSEPVEVEMIARLLDRLGWRA